VVDYDDLLSYTVALLRMHRPTLDALRARYQHVCVDEFQVRLIQENSA
jgi:superfamily I DNA/RNA helicase